jgi:hypothetical protein
MMKEMIVTQIAVSIVLVSDLTTSYHGLPEKMY